MAAPWFDQWAPSQFVTQPQIGDIQVPTVNSQSAAQNIDTTLHYKVAGTIILALVVVFVLQQTGFRFVVAASSSAGVGR
jgi:ABC-type uncharacterized transport system permease subunit